MERREVSVQKILDAYGVPPSIHTLNLLSTINITGDDDSVYFDDVDDEQQEVQKGKGYSKVHTSETLSEVTTIQTD
eukprot:11767310-Ditylum_brightwellii.AAC.1